ncbi:MAG TPA: pilus assembly protein PilM [Myxococcota bacterium]|nr:pilus assembly protein PilM [Myxococcota bacterium]
MATLVGIDLGSHTVKLAVLEGRLGKVQVRDYRVRTVSSEDEGLGPRLAAAAGLLSELQLEDTTTYAVGIPAEEVSVRNVHLPFSAGDRIEKTLTFELEGYVPFDLEDFVLDHRVHAAGQGSRVLCALAPRERVASRLEALTAIAVDPRHVVLDADVLATFGDGAGIQAIVDIGHERTLVALCRGGEHLGVRAISIGGGVLTQALVDELGISWQDAEGAKHAARLSTAVQAEVEWEDEDLTEPGSLRQKEPGGVADVLRAAIRPLLAHLRATLIAMEDELEVGVDEVLLSGGSASLDGLPVFIADNLGVPVRRVHISTEADDLGDPSRFALAHALALRAAGLTGGQELQFRKDEFAYKGDIATMRTVLGFGAVAALMFCLVGAGLFVVRFVQYQAQILEVEGEIAAVVTETFPDVSAERASDSSMAKAIMLEKTSEVVDKVDALGSTVGGEPPTLSVLTDLSRSLPEATEASINVSELTINATGVSFRAETSGYEAAATIESALREEERFSNAKKADETKVGDGIKFSMSIPFEEEEEEEVDG